MTPFHSHSLVETIVIFFVALPFGLFFCAGAIACPWFLWTSRKEKKDLQEWLFNLVVLLGLGCISGILGLGAIKEVIAFFK
jgi:uncharacterized membrane protein